MKASYEKDEAGFGTSEARNKIVENTIKTAVEFAATAAAAAKKFEIEVIDSKGEPIELHKQKLKPEKEHN